MDDEGDEGGAPWVAWWEVGVGEEVVDEGAPVAAMRLLFDAEISLGDFDDVFAECGGSEDGFVASFWVESEFVPDEIVQCADGLPCSVGGIEDGGDGGECERVDDDVLHGFTPRDGWCFVGLCFAGCC